MRSTRRDAQPLTVRQPAKPVERSRLRQPEKGPAQAEGSSSIKDFFVAPLSHDSIGCISRILGRHSFGKRYENNEDLTKGSIHH